MNDFYKPLEAAPSIYHIYEPAGVCSTLILGTASALLIDTGYGFDNLPAQIQALTDLPLQIVNTHCHLDHAGGNYLFPQKAFIHPDELEVYRFYQDEKPNHTVFVEGKIAKGKINNPFPPGFDREAYIQYKPVGFQFLRDHHIFDLGGRKVEVIFLPGHTSGSITLFDHKTGTLIGGDNLGASLWMLFPQSAPISTFEERLTYIIKNYPVKHVLSSHEKTPYPPQLLNHLLHAVRTCSPETSSDFIHPRLGYKALHHKEPVDDIAGLKKIHLVYPYPDSKSRP